MVLILGLLLPPYPSSEFNRSDHGLRQYIFFSRQCTFFCHSPDNSETIIYLIYKGLSTEVAIDNSSQIQHTLRGTRWLDWCDLTPGEEFEGVQDVKLIPSNFKTFSMTSMVECPTRKRNLLSEVSGPLFDRSVVIMLATILSSAFPISFRRQIGLRDDGEPISFFPLAESVPDLLISTLLGIFQFWGTFWGTTLCYRWVW